MEHRFNIEIAADVEERAAIILDNIFFWCEHNRANNKNYYDNFYWTYNSIKAFLELFPYMTERKIYKALDTLEKKGYIMKGCYNQNKYDRTKWYAVTEKTIAYYKKTKSILPTSNIDKSKKDNACYEKELPIPDNKPINKQINKTDYNNSFDKNNFNDLSKKDVDDIYNIIISTNQKTQTQIPISKDINSFFEKEIKQLFSFNKNYTANEIILAIKNLSLLLCVPKHERWLVTISWNWFCKHFIELLPEYFSLEQYKIKIKNNIKKLDCSRYANWGCK